MRVHVSSQGLEKKNRKTLHAFIAEQAKKLEEKLGSLAERDASLKGTLQQHAKTSRFRFGANLHVLHKIISAEEEGEDAFTVIREVFSEIERQAQRHKSKLKNEHLWKRKVRRKKLAEIAPAAGRRADQSGTQTHTPARWFEQIRPWLDDLHSFAVHEITYLQATNDLRPDDILPDELVDAVIVSAYEKQHEKPQDLSTRAWLHQLAIDLLDQEVSLSQKRRKAISLESTIEDEDIDTDIYEFYQPDEVLKLEDLISVPDRLPTAEAERARERQIKEQRGIARLPKTWRRAALLHHTAGFPVETVAAIMRLENAMVQELLDITARFLRDSQGSASVSIEQAFTIREEPCPAPLLAELKTKFTGEQNK